MKHSSVLNAELNFDWNDSSLFSVKLIQSQKNRKTTFLTVKIEKYFGIKFE